MKDSWLARKDISALFEDEPADTGEGVLDSQSVSLPNRTPAIHDPIQKIPVLDPLGFLEHLSGGKLRDPIRDRLMRLLTNRSK